MKILTKIIYMIERATKKSLIKLTIYSTNYNLIKSMSKR